VPATEPQVVSLPWPVPAGRANQREGPRRKIQFDLPVTRDARRLQYSDRRRAGVARGLSLRLTESVALSGPGLILDLNGGLNFKFFAL
jgi:hypothetical protein